MRVCVCVDLLCVLSPTVVSCVARFCGIDRRCAHRGHGVERAAKKIKGVKLLRSWQGFRGRMQTIGVAGALCDTEG